MVLPTLPARESVFMVVVERKLRDKVGFGWVVDSGAANILAKVATWAGRESNSYSLAGGRF